VQLRKRGLFQPPMKLPQVARVAARRKSFWHLFGTSPVVNSDVPCWLHVSEDSHSSTLLVTVFGVEQFQLEDRDDRSTI